MFYPFSWLPLNKRKLVFDNFGGRGYGDNPKYIADELLKQDNLLKIVEDMQKDFDRFEPSQKTENENTGNSEDNKVNYDGF